MGGQEGIWCHPGQDCPGRMGLSVACRGGVDQLPDMVDDEICWRYKEVVHSCKRCSDEVLALAGAGFCDDLEHREGFVGGAFLEGARDPDMCAFSCRPHREAAVGYMVG